MNHPGLTLGAAAAIALILGRRRGLLAAAMTVGGFVLRTPAVRRQVTAWLLSRTVSRRVLQRRFDS